MQEIAVTGTDIWYYFICPRESWLMMHRIAPDEEDENVEIGRFIHEYRYAREKKEIAIDNIKIDKLKTVNGQVVIQEVKKSSKFLKSATYQLLYYLYNLRLMGIEAHGELLFPEEKKKEAVHLNEQTMKELEAAVKAIQRIAKLPVPPKPKKIVFCRQCAYREYCWAEEIE